MIRTMLRPDVLVFARFATVGIASNALLSVLYLVLASGLGVAPGVSATVAWIVGVTVSFLITRSWTWGHTGPRGSTFVRYGLLYATAYVLNILLLMLLVDRMGFRHELVQGVLIVLFGLSLYLGQRFWVFRSGTDT